MNKSYYLASAMLVAASGAMAGGMDRSGQSIAPIFEDGTYAELSFGSVMPSVSGTFMGVVDSGNMSGDYTSASLAYKRDFGDAFSAAIIVDQPFGADVDYPADALGYPLAGSTATVETYAVTAIARYKFNDNFSVHGGVRSLTSSGEVDLSMPTGNYTMETSTERDWSYLVGVAYEIPDIALRAALTYNSETTIDFETTEMGFIPGDMEVVMPRSVNFDFQTGIAEDTLLMFSARWAKWTETEIAPNNFPSNPLVDHSDDTISYSLGVGRRFNDKWSGSVMLGYEPTYDAIKGNLSPTDGYKSVGLGLRYQATDTVAVSGGVRYVWVGDATTSGLNAEFEDNDAFGVGLKVSYNF